jgi:hypothetical protein
VIAVPAPASTANRIRRAICPRDDPPIRFRPG